MKMLRSIAVCIIAILLMTTTVFAAEEFVSTDIAFHIENGPGTVTIEALNDSPAPDELVIENIDKGAFIVTFSEPGDYQYRICQKPGNNDNIIYDETVYIVTVSVLRDDDGDLYTILSINFENDSFKQDDIIFKNKIKPQPTPTPTPVTPPNKAPDTGDKTNIMFYSILMSLSVIMLTLLIRKRIKTK